MSRERNEEKKGLSPTQRKACVVLALCALAVVMSILAAWVLPTKLGLFAGGKDSYDPDAYPLDTTLDSILPQSAADDAYITASVFAGDQYAVTLQKDTRITLNQFVGQEGLQISKALSTSCVNFASDASSYTIPQAIPKMKGPPRLCGAGRERCGRLGQCGLLHCRLQAVPAEHPLGLRLLRHHRGGHPARYRGQHERCRDPDPH